MDILTRTTGTITISGGVDEGVIEHGRILHNGDTITIMRLSDTIEPRCRGCEPSRERRWVQVDTLEDIVAKEGRNDSFTIVGRSRQLRTEVRCAPEEQMIEILVEPKGCQECN